ncbi:MAG: hypothetical protein JWN51_2900 [Phycisphaerales bacterium]|nr:hypothetical protein [Phycisphaerales bacterium]
MLRNSAILAALLFILHTSSGCVTSAVWRWASDDHVSPRQIAGVLAANNGASRALVIAYGPPRKESTLLVPIDGSGKPVAPFAYLGGTATDFWDNVTRDQFLSEVENHASIRPGTIVPTTREPGSSPTQCDEWIQNQTLSAVGYNIDSQNQLVTMSVEDALSDPAHCHVVIVPSRHTRLMPERAPVAVLATPFTVAADVVVTPIFVVVFSLAILADPHGLP